ncbi:hypothetical protein Tco_0694424 [Tanacetum coccineum]
MTVSILRNRLKRQWPQEGYRKRPYEKVEHWMDNSITFPSLPRYQLMNCPVVVEAMIEGFRLSDEIEAERISNTTGGVLRISRTGMRSLGVVASTIYSMMKFLTSNGIATISTTRETLREYRKIEEAQDLCRHACVTDHTLMQTNSEVANLRDSLALGRKPPKSSTEEKILVNDNYPEQLVTIGGGLSAECRHALIHTFRKNVDIFAWTPTDMTCIQRAITEHSLDTYPHIEPKAPKKRSLAPRQEEGGD